MAVEKVAEKLVLEMMEHHRKVRLDAACEDLSKIKFSSRELVDLTRRLLGESETAQVLIFYSYLENSLEELIAQHLLHLDNRKAKERLFGVNAPLGTSSARMLLAYHLGWLRPETYQQVDSLRKVRNEFAHRAFKVDFDDPKVASHIGNMDPKMFQELVDGGLPREAVDHLDTILAKMLLIACLVFQEIVTHPIARRYMLLVKDIMERSPPILDDFKKHCIEATDLIKGAAVKTAQAPK